MTDKSIKLEVGKMSYKVLSVLRFTHAVALADFSQRLDEAVADGWSPTSSLETIILAADYCSFTVMLSKYEYATTTLLNEGMHNLERSVTESL